MRPFKPLIALGVGLFLAGCSSAPQPVPVEWDKPFQFTNSVLPVWQESTAVTPSPVVSGHWVRVIRDFKEEEQSWPPDIWYAVVHSSAVAVSAPDATAFFSTKSWLRRHGASGVIAWQPKTTCLICHTTDITLSR